MAASRKTSMFLRHLSAYCASEMSAKLSRLAVILVVARTMTPEAIGLAAAAMAASDFLKAFTENGITQRIIKASEEELKETCRTASWLFWTWCSGLCLLQITLAVGFWTWTGNGIVAVLIGLLALEYLFMPGGLVQCALALREGRMTSTAAVAATQVVGANLLTALLAAIWPSPLAIVLPKLLSAPVWLIGMRRLRPWQRTPGPSGPVRPFVGFGAAVLGVEIVKAMRLQADKLLIGGLLGAEALGIWFFAFNAGLGLATSFANAFALVLFPHLCAADDRAKALGRALGVSLLILTPVVIIQGLLAPVYVPVLFGERWAEMSGLVSILCFAAVPGLVWSATGQYLRAEDRAGTEFTLSATLAAATLVFTIALAPFGLEAVAWGTLSAALVLQLGASLIVLRPTLLTHRLEV